MNKQELIKKYEYMNHDCFRRVDVSKVLADLRQLDEHENGHADEAPRYVKNILARLRELPLHDREVWLKTIMGEFEQDFSRAKWREGYEQGKVEGLIGREKVVVPQFVADWYEENKDDFETGLFCSIDLIPSCYEEGELSDFEEWLVDEHTKPFQTLVNMHQFGYTVEKEKRYLVKIIGITNYNSYLNYHKGENKWTIESRVETDAIRTGHTRKELEQASFGWVFDCPGIEIEEVEE